MLGRGVTAGASTICFIYPDRAGQNRAHNEKLTALNEELSQEVSSLREEVSSLREQWEGNWQVVAFYETITAKDAEIERLLARVAVLEAPRGKGTTTSSTTHTPTVPLMHTSVVASPTVHVRHPTVSLPSPRLSPHPSHVLGSVHVTRAASIRRGKAPPVSAFTGRDLECQLNNWLPSLESQYTARMHG